jgi:hypothetical protein
VLGEHRFVARDSFQGKLKLASEGDKLVKSRSTGENQGSGVKDDVVRNADVVSVRSKTSIRTAVFKGRTKIESDSTKVVPSLASWIVSDNEGATRRDG